MTPTSILMVVIILFVSMLIAGMVLFRINIGKSKTDSPVTFATRRNSIVIIFVILIFLMIWISKMMNGDLDEQGMSVTTTVLVAVIGGASIILLLIDLIRKK